MTCRVDFALILDPFSRGSLPNDFNVLARAAQRAVECAAVPGRNRLIGDSETQEKPSSGKILKRGRLNSQRDGAPAVDVIDSRSQIQLPCARRDSGKKDEGIGAVGLALPERAKAGLFDQRR